MAKVNLTWAKEQMDSNKVPSSVQQSVIDLLETWQGSEVAEPQEHRVIDLFSELAFGHALIEKKPDEFWTQAVQGLVSIGQTIRVRRDAFEGRLGSVHNGRVCRVVGVRYGDIIVRSIDGREPFLDGAHYPATALEVKIR